MPELFFFLPGGRVQLTVPLYIRDVHEVASEDHLWEEVA